MRTRLTIRWLLAIIALFAVGFGGFVAGTRTMRVVTFPAGSSIRLDPDAVVTHLPDGSWQIEMARRPPWMGIDPFWAVLILSITTATAWVVASRRKRPQR
ncbi:MAG TPA: hypothetical protein VGH33_06105 [Isosphaeraceae bacterium]|jgi:hypothetical protein